MPTSITELKRFLVAAKRSTYAAQGDAASLGPLLPDSKQLEYSEKNLFYRDIYFGMFRFSGQEVVYQAGKAVWSMTYSGGLNPDVSRDAAIATYAFLREALLALPADLPLRGPSALEKGNLRYLYQCSGPLESFQGQESISESGNPLYRLDFAGGLLA